ncbi:MAG: hypothetical protein PW786_11150 [Arachidicoccus sp.]|nr:hypothetical protein [Arachidicoccus sp.]
MKKYFIGCMGVIMAIAASAFTVIKNKAAGDQFGDNGNSGSSCQYNKLSSSYNNTLCDNEARTPCTYQVTDEGASHITASAYSSTDMATFLANGWVEKIGTESGIYNGN